MQSLNQYILFSVPSVGEGEPILYATFSFVSSNVADLKSMYTPAKPQAIPTFLTQLVRHFIHHEELLTILYQHGASQELNIIQRLIAFRVQTLSLFMGIVINPSKTSLHQHIASLLQFDNQVFTTHFIQNLKSAWAPEVIYDACRLTLLQQGLRLEHSQLPPNICCK